MLIRSLLAAMAVLILCTRASAGCSPVTHDGANYSVCTFNPAVDAIEVFSLDPDGVPIANFARLEALLAIEDKELLFAMNAGMFDENLLPIGLYVEDGLVEKKVNRRSGSGNFHLKPNGVFFIAEGKAQVMETEAFVKSGRKPEYATQSGPMLVINGRIHPKFSAAGTSEKIRNGVGVQADGTVVFVLSETAVNFHRFATLFKDLYGCRNALFLDGSVSSLYSTELQRNDRYVPLGPMVGVHRVK
jgi:prepilin-type processing-associated H-X9-DG protein